MITSVVGGRVGALFPLVYRRLTYRPGLRGSRKSFPRVNVIYKHKTSREGERVAGRYGDARLGV